MGLQRVRQDRAANTPTFRVERGGLEAEERARKYCGELVVRFLHRAGVWNSCMVLLIHTRYPSSGDLSPVDPSMQLRSHPLPGSPLALGISSAFVSEVTSRLQAFLVGWIQIEAANGSLLPVAHFSSILCLHRLWEHSLVPTQPGFLACYQSSEPRSFAPKISSGSDAWGHCVCLFSRDTYLIFFFFFKDFSDVGHF